jgi:hypothetical protein
MATFGAYQQCPYCAQWVPPQATHCLHCRNAVPAAGAPSPVREGATPPLQALSPPPPPAAPRYPDVAADSYPRRRRGTYADCPHCGCPGDAEKVSFTWWGGVLGPSLLTHVCCRACGTCYNGRTGGDNTTGIVVYSVVCGVIGLVVGFLLCAGGGAGLFR